MKKNIIICGLIGGAISIMGFILMPKDVKHFEYGMIYGYASMLLAFSLIFVAIRNFRDKYNNGFVSFGKAFRIGLYITLISSTIYVISWLIMYFYFIPDFMDQYAAYSIEKMKSAGASKAELDKSIAEMADFKKLYQNPFFNAMVTYLEILPVGLIVSLIAAAILKKKTQGDPQVI